MHVNYPRAFILLQFSIFCLLLTFSSLTDFGWVTLQIQPDVLRRHYVMETFPRNPFLSPIIRLLPPNPVSIREMLQSRFLLKTWEPQVGASERCREVVTALVCSDRARPSVSGNIYKIVCGECYIINSEAAYWLTCFGWFKCQKDQKLKFVRCKVKQA